MVGTMLNMKTDEELFEANLFAGEIYFSGSMATRDNGIVHSRIRRFSNRSEYTDRILTEFKRTITESTARFPVQKTAARHDGLPIKLEKTISRDANDADGTDNVNLPRIQYSLGWQNARRATDHDGYYIVPMVQYYYGHTGGWFNGQIFGCGAGARLSLAVYVFDATDGKKIFHYSADRRQISEYQFRSNTVKMSQDLAKLEREVLADLARELRSI